MAAPTFAPALGLVDAAGVPISATNPLSVSLVAGGGGTAVSIADGADVTLGSLADSSSALTVNGLLKAIKALLGAPLAVTGSFYQATQPVSIAAPVAVTGTFWQATQPVSGSLTVSGSVSVSNFPATQPVSGSVSVSNFPASQAVTGTFWQATQPVSGTVAVTNSNLDAALSTLATKAQLPTTLGITTKAGSLSVALASDQVGTAGSASTTVMSVQGVASMTAVQVTPPAGIGQQTLANSISIGFNSSQVGTAGSSATTVLSVQGIASGTALPVSQTASSATYINSNTSTVVKASAGTLMAIVMANVAASGTVAVYNSPSTTANLIATVVPITTTPIVAQFGPKGIAMSNGIYVVTNGTSGVTIVWE